MTFVLGGVDRFGKLGIATKGPPMSSEGQRPVTSVAVMDRFSHKVLAWRLSTTMDPDCCITALAEATVCSGTDQGSQ